MSNFGFLNPEWPDLAGAAARCEATVYSDPRTACFHARRCLELLVHWLYEFDAKLSILELVRERAKAG